MRNDERKFSEETVSQDTGPWTTIKGYFKAEKYPNTPPLDTNVELSIPTFAITWADRHKLMKELADVIAKYQI